MAAPHHIDAWHRWSLDVEADGQSATIRAPGPGHRHHLDRHRHSQDRRARRARLFCDAYGLQDRGELVDKILERQRAGRPATKQAADAGDPAYQRLWDMGAGAGVQRQIGDVLAHAPPSKTPSPNGRAGGQAPDTMRPPAGRDDGPENTPAPHRSHRTDPDTALCHSIDGNHPELREGQEDSALTADLDGWEVRLRYVRGCS
ncbi:MAG TPA: hypothetical protein VNO54_11065 [Streptosporangiaceae bacterium]|nr:hypothetical protein [Streptosporangiaceae bacterium]